MKLEVPFYLQTTKMNCGPIALKMALEFLGEKYSIEEMEEITGIKKGKSLSTIKLVIASKKLGFKTKFYSKHINFNPENLKLDFYKKYGILNQSEISKALEEAKELGIELYEKTLTIPEIIDNIQEDRVIIILLNWNIIKGTEGYQGHFVPVVGYDSENIYVHNHDFLNPTAFLPIKKELFEIARKSTGTDEDILVIYRKFEA